MQSATTIDQLQSTIRSRVLAFRDDAGLLTVCPSTFEEFFLDQEDERFGPADMMSNNRAIGWMWPCGSVYMDSELEEDQDVARLGVRYKNVDVVASIAGAPHTLTTERALAHYRKNGWLQSERLHVADETLPNETILLYRPTIVIHDLKATQTPLAVATAELRIEVAGDSGLIISAILLGISVLDKRSPKAAAYFLAHVLALHLGYLCAFAIDYGQDKIKHIVLLGTPPLKFSGSAMANDAQSLALRRFNELFANRATCQDELDDMGITLIDLYSQTDLATIPIKAGPAIAEAVATFATSGKRPGLEAFVQRADSARVRFEQSGILDAIRAAAGATIQIGPVQNDPDSPSMTIRDVNVTSPLSRKPLSMQVLSYLPLLDDYPFETWDNSSLGVLDSLELIHQGITHGEGSAAQTLQKLGYSSVPSQCLVLQPPNRKMVKRTAIGELACLMVAATRVQKYPYSMLIWELPLSPRPDYEWDEGQDDYSRYGHLKNAMLKVGFLQTSDWVFALPAMLWELTITTARKEII